jgi:hypothetical protein
MVIEGGTEMMANSSRTYSPNLLAVITLGVAVFATLWAAPESSAQSRNPVLPKLSVARALFFKNNPEARSAFMAGLPRRPAGPPRPTSAMVHPPVFGGSWTAVTMAPAGSLCNPLLLTDGSVIVHECATPIWYRLVPSNTGDYASGTWSQIGSLPAGYGPQYNAAAVRSR